MTPQHAATTLRDAIVCINDRRPPLLAWALTQRPPPAATTAQE